MANLYFPGCKVKGDFPAASEKLAAYIQSKRVVTPVGCCRVDPHTTPHHKHRRTVYHKLLHKKSVYQILLRK